MRLYISNCYLIFFSKGHGLWSKIIGEIPTWEFHTILIQDNTKYSYSKCVLEFVVKETVQ